MASTPPLEGDLRVLHRLHGRPRGGVRAARPRDAVAHRRVRGPEGRGRPGRRRWPTRVAGELIASEVEIRSGKGERLRGRARPPARAAPAPVRARRRRRTCCSARPGTHPWSPWQDQRIIDTPHYRLVEESCSTSRGATTPSATTCTWACRDPIAPSPCAMRCALCSPCCSPRPRTRRSRGQLQRTALRPHRDLHAHVPALRHSRPLRQLGGLRVYVDFLYRTHSIIENTQIWWSVRPHLTLRHGRAAHHGCAVVCGRVDRAAGAGLRLRGAGGARLRRRTSARGDPGALDRGEPVARDTVRPGREADRPRGRSRGPGRGGGRAAAGLDGRRARRARPRHAHGGPRADAATATAPSGNAAATRRASRWERLRRDRRGTQATYAESARRWRRRAERQRHEPRRSTTTSTTTRPRARRATST